MRIYHLVEAESLWALSQRGSVNLPQVRDLQDKLRAAGFDPGPSDGWYGQRTANAVRAYQQANNLAVDGDAGPQTLGSLGMAGAQQTPAQPTPPAETPPAPAPRQPAREPGPTPAPAPTRREPEPTRREPAQLDTSGLAPFTPTTANEIYTSDDAVNYIITQWVEQGRPNNFLARANAITHALITRGIQRRSAAGLIEINIYEWGQASGLITDDDIASVPGKEYIYTTRNAVGYALHMMSQNRDQWNAQNYRNYTIRIRNELIREGYIRPSAAGLFDIYLDNWLRRRR